MTRTTAFFASILLVATLSIACSSSKEGQQIVTAEQSTPVTQAVAQTRTGTITFGTYTKPSEKSLSEIQDGGEFITTLFWLRAIAQNPYAYPEIDPRRAGSEIPLVLGKGIGQNALVRPIRTLFGVTLYSVVVGKAPVSEQNEGTWVSVTTRTSGSFSWDPPVVEDEYLAWIKSTQRGTWVLQEIKRNP